MTAMLFTMTFDRAEFVRRIRAAADQGVFWGTSSWKYAGWRGTLYDQARYVYRGKLSEARFERQCLAEYAEVFKTVSVDAAYYKFPDERWIGEMVSQVPPDFLFSLKVTDEITAKRFPNLPRFGQRAGTANPNFLNADLFASAFLQPCAPFRKNIGVLMFEFAQLRPDDFARGRDFAEALDQFLGRLPNDWRYGVEIRNRNFLHADYFAVLARHGVTHIYNSWERMPPVTEQVALTGSGTTPDRVVARLLLKPGRCYEDAVQAFSPYDRVKEPYPEGRTAGIHLVRQTRGSGGQTKAFIYVNNRLEGNALETIAAILDAA
jgi:uncharacterized protein YecE (DUF72 family)